MILKVIKVEGEAPYYAGFKVTLVGDGGVQLRGISSSDLGEKRPYIGQYFRIDITPVEQIFNMETGQIAYENKQIV